MNKYFIILFFLAVTIVMAGNVKGIVLNVNNDLQTFYNGTSMNDYYGIYNLTNSGVTVNNGYYTFGLNGNTSLSNAATNKYINISKNFSITMWIKPAICNAFQDLMTNSFSSNYRFDMGLNSGNSLLVGFNNGTTWLQKKSSNNPTALSCGDWHFIFITYNTINGFNMYVDMANQTGSNNPTGTFTTGFRLGNLTNNQYYNGSMTLVRIYNSTLDYQYGWTIYGRGLGNTDCINFIENQKIYTDGIGCAANYYLNNNAGYGAISLYGANISASGSNFYGNSTTFSTVFRLYENSTISDFNIYSGYSYGIYSNNKNNKIMNGYIFNCSTYGIYMLPGSDNAYVNNITIERCYDNIEINNNDSIYSNLNLLNAIHAGFDFHDHYGQNNQTLTKNNIAFNILLDNSEFGENNAAGAVYGNDASNYTLYNFTIRGFGNASFNNNINSKAVYIGGGKYSNGNTLFNFAISNVTAFCLDSAQTNFILENSSFQNCGREGIYIQGNEDNTSESGSAKLKNLVFGEGMNKIISGGTTTNYINMSNNNGFSINSTGTTSTITYVYSLLQYYPFNDVYNVSTASVLSSNVDNYSLTLSAGQQIIIDDYYCNKHYIDSGISYTCNATTCKFTTSNCTFISGRTS